MPKIIRPVGWNFPQRGGARMAASPPREPTPCPVCGHPTGDCKGGDHEVWDGTEPDDPMVVVESDVYVDTPSPGAPDRPMTFLAFASGRSYRRSRIEQVKEKYGVRVLYHEATPTSSQETK